MIARTRVRASTGRSWTFTHWSGHAVGISLSHAWRAGSCARDAEGDASCWSFSRQQNLSAREPRSEHSNLKR
jgi:hypothetical protein